MNYEVHTSYLVYSTYPSKWHELWLVNYTVAAEDEKEAGIEVEVEVEDGGKLYMSPCKRSS